MATLTSELYGNRAAANATGAVTRRSPIGAAPAGELRASMPDGTPNSAAAGSSHDEDRALVGRAQCGDRAAFDQLVIKYQHRVAALLQRYIANPAERDDVAQEVFLRAYRGLDRFRGESAFYTWLYRVTVNAATNHRVSLGRQPLSRAVDADHAEQFHHSVLLRDGDTPEHNAATQELNGAIERALDAMPECLSQALTLREMKGLSYEAIARTMNCPIGTVRSRIARARDVIDDSIRPMLDTPRGATGRTA